MGEREIWDEKRNNLNGVEKVLGKDYAGISSLR